MVPVFEIFGKQIAIYPIMTLVGIFVAGTYACYLAKRQGYDDNDMIFFLLICAVGAAIGMHVLYGITNIPLIMKVIQNPSAVDSWKKFWNVLFAVFGGSVFYGGLLGGIAAGLICGKCKKLDLGAWADMLAPVVPLFHFFGRIGCFLGGCCYGVACKIGFTYHYSLLEEANGVRRFPIQLVEAGFNLLLFGVLAALLKRGKCRNKLFFVYLLSYAAARFVFEFFRGDALRGIWLGLSTSQWVSLGILVGAGTLLWKTLRKEKTAASENS